MIYLSILKGGLNAWALRPEYNPVSFLSTAQPPPQGFAIREPFTLGYNTKRRGLIIMPIPQSLRESITHVRRHHYQGGQWWAEEVEVVREEALTLFVNGHEFVTMVVTPTDLEELVTGFLASENFISRADAITVFQHHPGTQQIWVRVPGLDPTRITQTGTRYLSSCCGRGRPGFYFIEDANISPLVVEPLSHPLTAETMTTLFEEFSQWTHQQHSGGLHAAGLAYGATLLTIRTDAGRHNALDKLYGYCLRQQIHLSDKAIVFSGRLSSEVILKAGRMGIPLIISNAAPTNLGIELAETLGITAVGFARNHELSVYSHPERILPF